MPILGYTTDCAVLSIANGEKCITFPGGAELCMSIPSAIPVTEGEQITALFGQLNSALAPLQPVFNIIEAVLAIFKCICAIATLNPFKIARCIPPLAEKIDALLKLIPQLSIPIMIKEFLDHLITFLDATISGIASLLLYQDRILQAETAAANTDINLSVIIDCARGDLDASLSFMNQQAKPVNSLIGLLNAFLQLIGLPCIPNLASPDLSEAYVTLLGEFKAVLGALRDLITIPIPKIPLSVNSEDC